MHPPLRAALLKGLNVRNPGIADVLAELAAEL